jgi:hypothetical protein
MKKTRFSDSQILAILKQCEGGVPVLQLCREHGMSSARFLQVALKVRRHGRVKHGATQGA